MSKPGSMETIVWDDEDGESWWVEQTNQYQDIRYERPGGDGNQPSWTDPAVEVAEKSPPINGAEPSLGEGLVTQLERVVDDEEQDEDEMVWGSQAVVEEWLDRTQPLWDRPTLDEGAWVSVLNGSVNEGGAAKAKSLTTLDMIVTDDEGAEAESLTALELTQSEDGGARALSLTISSKDDLQRLVVDQPTEPSRLVIKETGLDQSKERTTPPTPDLDHPGQDGQTGQTGGTKPEGGLCQPIGIPPIVEVAVDH